MQYSISEIGKRVYDLKNPREKRRYLTFLVRAFFHKREVNKLIKYFVEDDLRRKALEANPFPIEQITRAFFYNKSTLAERSQLIKEHYDILQERLQPEKFIELTSIHHFQPIWQSEFEGEAWRAELGIEAGQRKEGLLSLELNLGKEHLYQIMFWLAKNESGEPSLWIGALQGPNMAGAKDLIKKITKACHGYRTKNLILYMLQAVARSMDIKHIFAVSNYGYYANNHVRVDRKLKTNFGDFWLEAGGELSADKRFYELPLQESRKTMEEVPTRKRAVYRRRFALLDEVEATICKNVNAFLKLDV